MARSRRVATVLILGLIVALVWDALAWAATTRHLSTTGSDVGDCSVNPCKTIGYAISQSVSGDTIDIAPGTYVEHVTLNKSLTLHGAGAASTVIDGSFNGTVITIGSPSASLTVVISNLAIQHGQATNGGGLSSVPGTGMTNRVVLTGAVVSANKASVGGQGGGIYNAGTLAVSHTTINGNSTSSISCCRSDAPGVGGGIYNTGTLTVVASSVSGNLAQGAPLTCFPHPPCHGSFGFGGGLALVSGTATVTNTTVSGNTATALLGEGGGLYVASGSATLTNTTVSGNTAIGEEGEGGGLYVASGTATLTNTTVSGNTARAIQGGVGGGIRAASGAAKLTNTILAKNNVQGSPGSSTYGPDCYPSVISGGHNLLGWSLSCTGFTGLGDLVNVNPVLGPLQDNGGPTFTMAVGAGSPAIAAADNSVCANAQVGGVDQRGLPRFDDPQCDIGAYEVRP